MDQLTRRIDRQPSLDEFIDGDVEDGGDGQLMPAQAKASWRHSLPPWVHRQNSAYDGRPETAVVRLVDRLAYPSDISGHQRGTVAHDGSVDGAQRGNGYY